MTKETNSEQPLSLAHCTLNTNIDNHHKCKDLMPSGIPDSSLGANDYSAYAPLDLRVASCIRQDIVKNIAQTQYNNIQCKKQELSHALHHLRKQGAVVDGSEIPNTEDRAKLRGASEHMATLLDGLAKKEKALGATASLVTPNSHNVEGSNLVHASNAIHKLTELSTTNKAKSHKAKTQAILHVAADVATQAGIKTLPTDHDLASSGGGAGHIHNPYFAHT